MLMALALLLPLVLLPVRTYAQQSSLPVPPLQWLNVASAFSGDTPPPLSHAAIGYDERSNKVIIFGGEQNGIPQSTTYLLDLKSRSWSRPSPPASLTRSPPARSHSVSGVDFAGNNRHGFVVIGGKGANGSPLADVWEFDFTYSFWSEVQITSTAPAIWGAVGGIDSRVLPIQDTVLPGPNNTFYLAGGNGKSLSEVWTLSLSGTLSPNLPNSAVGHFSRQSVDPGKLPSPTDQTGTIVGQRIVSFGSQDARVIDALNAVSISPESCPAPRVGAALVPNFNTFSSDFGSQAFVLLGMLNSSLWNDNGNLAKGEVDVLDVQSGSWSRLLPSGDPGSETETFPGPREGAVAVSIGSVLAGQLNVTDILVFGGKDNSSYLNEIWVLRTYNGVSTSTSSQWSGFGNGRLQSGVGASGSGVTVARISQCASQITAPSSSLPNPTGPSASIPTPGPTSTDTRPTHAPASPYDTSIAHKALAPVSTALIFPALLAFLLSHNAVKERRVALVYSSGVLGVLALVSGIISFVFSFTSIHSTIINHKRAVSSSLILKTSHGQAGVVLFLTTYVVIPLLAGMVACSQYLRPRFVGNKALTRPSTPEPAEKPPSTPASVTVSRVQSTAELSHSPSPRRRTHSWGPSSFTFLQRDEIPTTNGSDTESSASHAAASRSFSVTNRPRRSSTGRLVANGSPPTSPRRNLSEMSWLERRRSLNAVSEIDYALTMAQRTPHPPTPATIDALVQAVPAPPRVSSTSPITFTIVLIFHLSLLALSVFTLVTLWDRAPRWSFSVFLAWISAFYIIILVTMWHHYRLRAAQSPSQTPERPISEVDSYACPVGSQDGSYTLHRATISSGMREDTFASFGHARSLEMDDGNDDDDEDEDVRQARIEQEIDRRDVSIVTVPKQGQPLRVTNA